MSDFIIYFLVPLLFNILMLAFVMIFVREKQKRLKQIIRLAIIWAAEALFLSGAHLFIEKLTASADKILGYTAVIILTVCATLAGLSIKGGFIHNRNAKLSRFFRISGICAIVFFTLEICLFNINSYTTEYKSIEIDLGKIGLSDEEFITTDGKTVTVIGNSAIEIFGPYTDMSFVNLDIKGKSEQINVDVSIKDSNLSRWYINVSQKRIVTSAGQCHFSINPFGELKSVQISFSNITSEVTVTGISLSNALVFEFSIIRYVFLLFIAVIVAAVKAWDLWKVRYNPRSIKQIIAIAALITVCVLGNVTMLLPSYPFLENDVDYPIDGYMNRYDPYIQQFDAFQKGQVNLDIAVDARIDDLENPYDWSERLEEAIDYPWDRAYYNGQYYSYFGIAPVFVVHYPYFLITGALPTIRMVTGIFAATAMVFLFLVILRLVKMFCKKANFLLLMLGLLSAAVSSGIFWWQNFSDIYNVALVSSDCFLLMTIWLGLLAYSRSAGWGRLFLLAGAGIACVLTIASRPVTALAALILAPAFIHILVNKDYKLRHKIACASSFLLPVFAGLAALLYYNYIRFDSPFDFGAGYQLTVSDINANSISFSMIPAAIIHYFFQLPAILPYFPFLKTSHFELINYGRYVYVGDSLGVLIFPSIASSYLLLTSVLRRNKKNYVKFYTYLCMALCTVITAVVNYCVAGVIIRYISEILLIMSVLSVPLLLEANEALDGITQLRGRHRTAFATIFIISFILGLIILLSFDIGTLRNSLPGLTPAIDKLIMFWQ